MRPLGVAAVNGIATGQRPQAIVPSVILCRGDHRREVHTLQPRPTARLRRQLLDIEAPGAIVRDDGVGGAAHADTLGQRTGIDTRNADAAPCAHPVIEIAGRAERGCRRDRLAHHTAERVRIGRFDIVLVGADIADVREGESDDLAGVGRIRNHLLIARHRGVETDFADGYAFGAKALAPDHRTISQNQYAGRAFGLGRRGRSGHGGSFGLYGFDAQTAGELGRGSACVNLFFLCREG